MTADHDRRWLALAVIGVAQLMIILDASIVNIALPHAQTALHISNADRQWALTAYTLTFGGLLLLGGRVADYLGRKRTFLVGAVRLRRRLRARRRGAVRRAGCSPPAPCRACSPRCSRRPCCP